MLRIAIATAALAAGATAGFAFEISSSSVSDGKWDKKYFADRIAGCDGGNVSPALAWKGAPAGTKSFALTLFDPDAPTGSGWWHWQVWNIPASTTGFAEGKIPEGAVQGKGDIGRPGYLGPCPPPGTGIHHYTFTIYALKTDKLDLDPMTASGAYIGYNLNGNAIAKATVVYTVPAQ
ncbi:MAG: YbhB/YbcL family Raf kinase inhibitor-like protein [Rhizobiales bacterium]|nr:YbhB/YbcL family Raf kinase inhibitor-like protein [Hyphomicrobiales bacterium]